MYITVHIYFNIYIYSTVYTLRKVLQRCRVFLQRKLASDKGKEGLDVKLKVIGNTAQNS
jgi:hypothetical protein